MYLLHPLSLFIAIIWTAALCIEGLSIDLSVDTVSKHLDYLNVAEHVLERDKRFLFGFGQKDPPEGKNCTTPSGKKGHCKKSSACTTSEKQGLLKNYNNLCIIENFLSVGICCPDDEIDITDGMNGLAGNLPAVASDDITNETPRDDGRPETRGCGMHSGVSGIYEGGWPWAAALIYKQQQFCGGGLITARHVLTAAHCTSGKTAEEFRVRLGEYDFTQLRESRDRTFNVTEIRQHVDFEPLTYQHDITIMVLDRKAGFNSYIWPICLPASGVDYSGRSAVVVGWGAMATNDPGSDVLMEVTVPVWQQRRCVEAYTEPIFSTSICAGETDRDACKGDSGGPLMLKAGSGRWVVIGVVSWGDGCGKENKPGIYVRVTEYLDWISQNTLE